MSDTPTSATIPEHFLSRVEDMAERSAVRKRTRTIRMSEDDSAEVERMMKDEGFDTFQSFVEHRLFGRRVKRRPGPATDQRPLDGLKSA